MAGQPISPREYEMSIEALIDRIEIYLDTGEGDSQQIIREAEELLELKDVYPEAINRHPELQGLLGELLARKQQERFRANRKEGEEREAPGCLLGWLFSGK